MKGLFSFHKIEYQYHKYFGLYEGCEIVSAESVTAPRSVHMGARNSNIFSLSVVRERLQRKYKLIMILPLWQRVAWMGLVRFQWGLPKSVYDIPLNRDRNKWFKLQFCILYKQNWITAILLHYIYYSIKYGGDVYVHRTKT